MVFADGVIYSCISTCERFPVIYLAIRTGPYNCSGRSDDHGVGFIGYVIVLCFSAAEGSFRYDCVGAHIFVASGLKAEFSAAGEVVDSVDCCRNINTVVNISVFLAVNRCFVRIIAVEAFWKDNVSIIFHFRTVQLKGHFKRIHFKRTDILRDFIIVCFRRTPIDFIGIISSICVRYGSGRSYGCSFTGN